MSPLEAHHSLAMAMSTPLTRDSRSQLLGSAVGQVNDGRCSFTPFLLFLLSPAVTKQGHTALAPKHRHARRSGCFSFLHVPRGNRAALFPWETGTSGMPLPKGNPQPSFGKHWVPELDLLQTSCLLASLALTPQNCVWAMSPW